MYGLDALQWSDEAPHDPLIFHTPKHCLYHIPLCFAFLPEALLAHLTHRRKSKVERTQFITIALFESTFNKYYRRIYELRQPFF